MEAAAWIIGSSLGVVTFAWWAERRCRRVNSYYERERQDPSVFEAGP